MKKLALIAAVAAAALVSTSAAYAGWYDAYGFYHPVCGYNAWGYWVCV